MRRNQRLRRCRRCAHELAFVLSGLRVTSMDGIDISYAYFKELQSAAIVDVDLHHLRLVTGSGAGCSTIGSDERATAELKDKDGKSVGTASFTEAGNGVRVRVEVKGLSAGLHAVHIHAVGKCEAQAFTSAGGHFNPAQNIGYKSPDGAHAGDLPNMLVAKDGSGRFEALTDAVTLRSGANSGGVIMARN